MGMTDEELVTAFKALTDAEGKQKEDVAHLRGVLEADTAALNEIAAGITEKGFKSISEVEARIVELSTELSAKLEQAQAVVEKAGF